MTTRIALLMALQAAASAPTLAPVGSPAVTRTHLPNRPKVTYAYAVIDPRQYRVSIKAFAHAVQMANVPQSVACAGLSITGGFSRRSGSRYEPEGLIRTVSGQISGLANWDDGGVLSLRESHASIKRIAAWRAAPIDDGMALQARPLLVFGGRVDEPLNRPERWNRVAVGTLTDGSIVFIGAFTARNNALTFRQFGEDAKTLLGANLSTLLNMDGGPSAFMHSPSVSLLPAQGAVTTYICAEPR